MITLVATRDPAAFVAVNAIVQMPTAPASGVPENTPVTVLNESPDVTRKSGVPPMKSTVETPHSVGELVALGPQSAIGTPLGQSIGDALLTVGIAT